MTQNNEHLDITQLEQINAVQSIREAKTLDDALRVMNGLAANGWLKLWDSATHPDGTSWRDKSPISQNEQQDVVAWLVKIPESRRGCSNDIVFYYKMSEMLKEHILAGDDVTPLYASPPKQIPDGWKLIGKVSEMGVVWYKQNPHAHPIGTEFYAVLPTTSLTSETNTEAGE